MKKLRLAQAQCWVKHEADTHPELQAIGEISHRLSYYLAFSPSSKKSQGRKKWGREEGRQRWGAGEAGFADSSPGKGISFPTQQQHQILVRFQGSSVALERGNEPLPALNSALGGSRLNCREKAWFSLQS
jgi:hypothetical protein